MTQVLVPEHAFSLGMELVDGGGILDEGMPRQLEHGRGERLLAKKVTLMFLVLVDGLVGGLGACVGKGWIRGKEVMDRGSFQGGRVGRGGLRMERIHAGCNQCLGVAVTKGKGAMEDNIAGGSIFVVGMEGASASSVVGVEGVARVVVVGSIGSHNGAVTDHSGVKAWRVVTKARQGNQGGWGRGCGGNLHQGHGVRTICGG